MPVIAEIGRKSFKGRLVMLGIYVVLTILGATMVYPFLITLSSSVANDFDYDRFAPLPRYLWSRSDRFVKGLTQYFNRYPDWHRQMRAYFPTMPAHWNSWQEIGRDRAAVDQFAQPYLNPSADALTRWERMAADYRQFVKEYPASDLMCTVWDIEASRFVRENYPTLEALADGWGFPVPSFHGVSFHAELSQPVWQQSWFPHHYAKFTDFERLKVKRKGDDLPAPRATPFAMRAVWRKLLESEEARSLGSLPDGEETLFPAPANGQLWEHFVATRYPLRLTALRTTPALADRYRQFLRERFRTLDNANRMLGTSAGDWDGFELAETAPAGRANETLRSVWADFVTTLPAADRRLTSSEHAFQSFLLTKYGSIERINAAYGWKLPRIEAAFPPFDVAYALTFRQHEGRLLRESLTSNYAAVADFLVGRGNAVVVTVALILLAILATLTINPLAAYALSRFNLRGKEKLVVFLLATMAFPAMVSAIPAYLLMRDLDLLNTFFALVLPGAANGMAIFILKGFFDSLPSELYDAATIDGANEWQIFTRVTMPMMKPILAINALGAFLWAYNSWEWALIICQEQRMWTIAVWLYQASQWWTGTPWVSTAGFVVVSIPTLLVFLFCQKIILRGIILPSMK